MPGVVFGDFLAAASGHLDAAVAVRAEEISGASGAAGELARLVTVMSRYCDDLAPCDEVEAFSRDDLHPWEHATIYAGAALRIAAACLQRADAGAAPRVVAETAPRRARYLAAATARLAAGRELLQTHLAVGPDGRTTGRSEWAAAVISAPVSRALLGEIGQWSLGLAPVTTRLADSVAERGRRGGLGQAFPVSVRAELATASQWLRAAGAAIRVALDAEPVRPADTELLHAISAAGVPQRRQPGSAVESVAGLCDGIAVSASRLRYAVSDGEDRARWPPGVTSGRSGGWQWTTQAAAVAGHLSELALRALATRAGQMAGSPVSEVRLNDAADLKVGMRAAWHQADRMWDVMIAEGSMLPAQAATDASDLVLRMGRLVWDDPHWTPARSRQAPRRSPAALAPERDMVTTVLAAVHEAADALACLAKAGMDAVEAASAAGRLYVPTRSLPENYNVPRPFATAPVSRCEVLHEVYRAAMTASVQAARALGDLAIAADGPSRPLALARAAAAAQSRRRGSQLWPDAGADGRPTLSDTPFRHSRASTGRPGPVEKAVRAQQVRDPVVLLRAAAIDNAARQLIAEAQNARHASGPPDTAPPSRRSAGSPARLAGQGFPSDVTARPAAGQPPDPARRAARPGSHVPRRIP
jgi:hypothetical protein